MTAVTAVMVAYHNEDRCLPRLDGLLDSLHHVGFDAELIVIDNSATPSRRLEAAVLDNGKGKPPGFSFPARYCWQDGVNLMYGPALNVAARLARHPYLLYICGNHGHALDPSWPEDLVLPLLADHKVAMTGCLQPSGDPGVMGFPGVPDVHVQGGVMAARVEALRRYPYPNGELAHAGSDVYESLRLMAYGWRLVDVPTIRSVWREDPGAGPWKYVHRGGGDEAS